MQESKMDPLFECLVAWVNTFEDISPGLLVKNSEDFKDGILMMKCLNNIDSETFNSEWMLKIKTDTNENWRLKFLNLKKILQTLTDYYTEVLNHTLTGFSMPNLNLILESTSTSEVEAELSHFLQLVLGCAVNCKRKSEFIGKIMEMNEYTQHMLMTAIQDLMSKDRGLARSSSSLSFSASSHDEDVNYQLKKTTIELGRVVELKDELDQKCKRLDKQCSELQEEKISLISELDKLKEKLQKEDNARRDPNNQINIQLKLQNRLETLQEEYFKLESDKEKYRIQFEAAKLEQDSLMEKNIEYKKIVQDSQSLKDELDILKHTSSKVEKLESTIETYKIRLEEMCDLKRQLTDLEESNTRYLEKMIGLEDEVRKMTSLKTQIDMYKKKVQELHENGLNDEMRFKKLEYEFKANEEQHMQMISEVRNERDRVQMEMERLKEQNEQLLLSSQSSSIAPKVNFSDDTLNTADLDGSFSSVELVNIPAETKEKIVRLYHENKMLKAKQTDFNEEQLHILHIQYEDEKQRSLDLQTRLNDTCKLKIELECQLDALTKKSGELSEMASSEQQLFKAKDDLIEELKGKLDQLQAKLSNDCNKSDVDNMQLLAQNEALMSELNELRESKDRELQLKQQELEDNQAKMKAYLEKAKIVIRSLDPSKTNIANDTEIQYLKNSLTEKEKIVKQLMKENDQLRNSHEQEENMMMSAWYNQGIALNRRATDERISSIGNSFLSQQRHLPSVLTGSPILNQNSSRKISPTNYPKKTVNINENIE